MRRLAPQVGLFLCTLSAPVSAGEPLAAAPRELAASMSFDHRMQDMLDFHMTHYEVNVTLRVEESGAARLQLQGSLNSKYASIRPGVPSNSQRPPVENRLPVDDRWTGQAHLEKDALVVQFDQSESGSVLKVDILWRCTPVTISVADKPTAAWSCATTQSSTSVSGPGHSLPPYLQLPMYLAPPATQLRVDVLSHGGANHRTAVSDARYSYSSKKPPPKR